MIQPNSHLKKKIGGIYGPTRSCDLSKVPQGVSFGQDCIPWSWCDQESKGIGQTAGVATFLLGLAVSFPLSALALGPAGVLLAPQHCWNSLGH